MTPSKSGTWFYESQGRQLGPVDWQSLVDLVHAGTVTPDTLIWGGEGDWQPASETPLASTFGKDNAVKSRKPPPLPGKHVNNTFGWLLVLVPVVGVVVSLIVQERRQRDGDVIVTGICIGLNILLCVLDGSRLKAAGHAAPPGWYALLIPIYLWKRATMAKQRQTIFASWCAVFVASLLLPMALAEGETAARVSCVQSIDSFVCSVIHDRGARSANVCWDVVIACAGGVEAVGHACQVISPLQTATRSIASSEIRNLEQCSAASAITVENVTLSLR